MEDKVQGSQSSTEESPSSVKSEIAREKPRDEHGHFVKSVHMDYSPADTLHPDRENPNPLSELVKENVSVTRSPISAPKKDDLIDIHVGNPLSRIEKLLEDIKRQKAFSFTLKGSLGVAGVVLALGVFGVFGSNQMLCSHGTQSFVGVVKTLQYEDEEKSSIPYYSKIMSYFSEPRSHKRVVIITDGNKIISIPYTRKLNFSEFNGSNVIVTGNYNSCSQSLTVNTPSGIEIIE